MSRPKLARSQGGFTVAEVMVAITLLLIGVLGTTTLLNGANGATLVNEKRTAATNLTRELGEAVSALQYSQLTDSSIVAALQARPGLADSSAAAGWQIERPSATEQPSAARRQTYTVTVTACAVDDSKDSLATAAQRTASGLTFCSGQSTGTGDADPDDYRRVKISVSYTDAQGRTHDSRQTKLISQTSRGTNPVPTVTSLDYNGSNPCTPTAGCDSTALSAGQISPCYWPNNNLFGTPTCFLATSTICSSNCATSIAFTVATSGSPTSVKWLVNGEVKGNATSAGSGNYTFSWSLGSSTYPQPTVDGSYQVAAQAYDATGAPVGDPVSKTVILNRFLPDQAAQSTIAGKDELWSVNEIEARPSGSGRRDRDIYWYTTSRYSGGNAGPIICLDNTDPSCQESTLTGTIQYLTWPIDRSPSGHGRNPSTYSCTNDCSLNVNAANVRPSAVASFTGTTGTGTATLNWTVSTANGGRGESSGTDCVDFFHIYRTATTVTTPTRNDRYDRTPYGVAVSPCGSTASTSWVDDSTGGVQHKYWITAVDTHLDESPLSSALTK
jgi:Tfp pilus assembly protein PilV